jgi:peptide-methionine (S)-S-oxide reductase
MKNILFLSILVSVFYSSCNAQEKSVKNKEKMENLSVATFGAGCFWCIETLFRDLKGVQSVVSGYMGGEVKEPTYRQICTGQTGHAEVIQIHFDSKVITFSQLLEVLWQVHDPTTINRQGNDIGTQYRSAIFYHNEEQAQKARYSKEKFKSYFERPIVTEISSASIFYEAEDYHQNYYNLHGDQPYCRAIIAPKVKKFKTHFSTLLK